jgi:putative nucleotidyltransferase with HDIG domain
VLTGRSRSDAINVFIWAVCVLAMLAALAWTVAWNGPVLQSVTQRLLFILLMPLAALAVHFPLHVGPKYNVTLVAAVQFAALLLLGPPAAMALIAIAALLGLVGIRVRTSLRGHTQRTWRSIFFNVAQHVLSTAAGGVAYFGILPHQIPAPQDRFENIWAVPFAALAMFVTSSGLVSVIAGIQSGRPPLEVWLSVRKRELLHETGLFLLGLVAARTAQSDPWIPLVMVLPTWIIYLSTKRNVLLVEQTIDAVEALADVVDRRDPYTFQHSKRVADYAQKIARAMKLPSEQVEQIRLAARVHDLGKIGVPNEVLHKQGRLAPDEWDVMRSHPEMGYEILSKFPEYSDGRELVLAHHERYDGNGYPNALSAKHLSIGAQIIAVADTLDAMTSDRPYRKALPVEEALSALRLGKGTQFNPDVVDAVERLVADGSDRAPLLADLSRQSAVSPSSTPLAGASLPVAPGSPASLAPVAPA